MHVSVAFAIRNGIMFNFDLSLRGERDIFIPDSKLSLSLQVQHVFELDEKKRKSVI